MDAKEAGSKFLAKTCDFLVSLPFDLKFLQEATADLDLEKGVRELAGGVLIHVLSRHDGTAPERYLEDVVLVRVALSRVAKEGGEAAAAFTARFPEIYDTLEADLAVFRQCLGEDVWAWLGNRLAGFARLSLKGKRPAEYVDDEEALESLYEDGRAFQTNYGVSETQLRNKLRRPEQLVELLQRRYSEELKRRPAQASLQTDD